ncbi:MAG: hypothetical protein AB7O38_22100 [Pirellulaceae bacterium]
MLSPAWRWAVLHPARLPSLFIGIMLAGALFLRLAATTGELWLDEIWSLELASSVASPLRIFTDLRHDNNHLLNTCLLWLLGPELAPAACRIPAVLAGTATVWLGSVLAARQGRLAAVTALTVLGSSYLLIHYSSEARGYAWLLLFTCAAVETLLRWTDTGRMGWLIMFWVTGLLGLLAHPLFAHVSAGAAMWTLFHERSRPPRCLDAGQVPVGSRTGSTRAGGRVAVALSPVSRGNRPGACR